MFVYFVKAHDSVGLIKIGTARNVDRRVENMQTG